MGASSLVAPQLREAGGRAELERLRPLLAAMSSARRKDVSVCCASAPCILSNSPRSRCSSGSASTMPVASESANPSSRYGKPSAGRPACVHASAARQQHSERCRMPPPSSSNMRRPLRTQARPASTSASVVFGRARRRPSLEDGGKCLPIAKSVLFANCGGLFGPHPDDLRLATQLVQPRRPRERGGQAEGVA